MKKETKDALHQAQSTGSDTVEGAAVFRALAILRSVRRSSRGRLPLLESCSVALEQADAFKRWCAQDTPIRRVQVWVEGQPVMTVSPDEDSVVLETFSFGVTSTKDAVMQILKADEGEEPIILLILPLASVPASGFDTVSEFPNGQRLKLKIVIEEPGRFHTTVAFTAENQNDDAQLMSSASVRETRTKTRDPESPPRSLWGYIPVMLFQPRMSRLAFASAMMITVLTFALITLQTDRHGNLQTPTLGLAYKEARNEDIASAPNTSVAESQPTPQSQKRRLLSRNSRPAIATTLVLLPYSAVRGPNTTLTSPVPRAVVKPDSNIHLSFRLPKDSEAGMYSIRMVDPYDNTLYETQARSSDGKTLRIVPPAKTFPRGNHTFRVSSKNQVPFYYSLEVTAK